MVFFTSKLFDMGYRVINCIVSRMLFSKSKLILIKYFCDVIKLYNRLKIIFSNIFPNIANVDTGL